MNIHDFIQQAERRLLRTNRDCPRLSAELIVAHVLQKDRIDILIDQKRPLTQKEEDQCRALLKRREKGEPVAYLLGNKEFYGLTLQVSQKTLIPRPETETLVDLVLDSYTKDQNFLFADLGTGSGNIGLAIAKNRKNAHGLLIDQSKEALLVAKNNIKRLNLERQLATIQARFASLPIRPHSLDLIVANPPYIAYAETAQVMDEVLAFEPHTALFADNNGLAALFSIIDTAPLFLKTTGHIYLEHGPTQGEMVRKRLREKFFLPNTKKDLAQRERISYGVFRSQGERCNESFS